MKNPEFNAEGYPTKKTLRVIRRWPHDDFEGLMYYVLEAWQYADLGWSRYGRRYSLSTVGWSGNEEIIVALQKNRMFWTLCWWSARRGGHYVFRLPRIFNGRKNSGG